MDTNILLEATLGERKVISIPKTIEAIGELGIRVEDLLPMHAITGCDTVGSLYRIGKVKALNVLQKNQDIQLHNHLSDSYQELEHKYKTCVHFACHCYGFGPQDSMNSLCSKCWHKKVGLAKKICPPLKSLPPTNDSFRENVKRALYQLAIWLNADQANPPSIEAIDWGWCRNQFNNLIPVTSCAEQIAPNSLLEIISCNCKAQRDRCNGARCSCNANRLQCTKFCRCGDDGVKCERYQNDDRDDDDDENEE